MRYLFIITVYFMGCTTHKAVTGTSTVTFDKQGHRGCRGLMPENTIPAMLHALDLHVTTLEMDVVVTKDQQLVVSHEPFFNHEITTKPDGSFVTEAEEKTLNIYRMTYNEVLRYDVGMKPHPRFPQQKKMAVVKPLLGQLIDSVLSYVQQHQLSMPYFNIETKSLPFTDNIYHPAPGEFVELLVKLIQEKKIEQYVIIQSFDFRTLQYLHQHYPQIKTAMLIEDDDKRGIEKQIEVLGFVPTIYSPHYSLVNEELIKYCHDRNIKVIPWTVNTKVEIEHLRKMGVDGIISDYPDLF